MKEKINTSKAKYKLYCVTSYGEGLIAFVIIENQQKEVARFNKLNFTVADYYLELLRSTPE